MSVSNPNTARKIKSRVSKRGTGARAMSLAVTMLAVGKKHRRGSEINMLKTGIMLDQVRLIRDLGVSLGLKARKVEDPQLRLRYSEMQLKCYNSNVTAAKAIPDFDPEGEDVEKPTRTRKSGGIQAAPSNLQAHSVTVNVHTNAKPPVTSPPDRSAEILLPATG